MMNGDNSMGRELKGQIGVGRRSTHTSINEAPDPDNFLQAPSDGINNRPSAASPAIDIEEMDSSESGKNDERLLSVALTEEENSDLNSRPAGSVNNYRGDGSVNVKVHKGLNEIIDLHGQEHNDYMAE